MELENINLIQPSGLVEAALVCLNLWFCLLLNIPLHCHNIDKSDKKKWQQLIGWFSIDRKNGNWEIFPKIFYINLIRFWKVEGGVTSFHIPRTLPSRPPPPIPPFPLPTPALLIYCIYSIFSEYWNLILVAYQKNSVLPFCYCCFMSSVRILSRVSSLEVDRDIDTLYI